MKKIKESVIYRQMPIQIIAPADKYLYMNVGSEGYFLCQKYAGYEWVKLGTTKVPAFLFFLKE